MSGPKARPRGGPEAAASPAPAPPSALTSPPASAATRPCTGPRRSWTGPGTGAMLQKREKVLLLRTFQGRTLRIVREHYLRPCVPCNSPLCPQPTACRNGQGLDGTGQGGRAGRRARGRPGGREEGREPQLDPESPGSAPRALPASGVTVRALPLWVGWKGSDQGWDQASPTPAWNSKPWAVASPNLSSSALEFLPPSPPRCNPTGRCPSLLVGAPDG